MKLLSNRYNHELLEEKIQALEEEFQELQNSKEDYQEEENLESFWVQMASLEEEIEILVEKLDEFNNEIPKDADYLQSFDKDDKHYEFYTLQGLYYVAIFSDFKTSYSEVNQGECSEEYYLEFLK